MYQDLFVTFYTLVGGHQQPLKDTQKTIPNRPPADLPGPGSSIEFVSPLIGGHLLPPPKSCKKNHEFANQGTSMSQEISKW